MSSNFCRAVKLQCGAFCRGAQCGCTLTRLLFLRKIVLSAPLSSNAKEINFLSLKTKLNWKLFSVSSPISFCFDTTSSSQKWSCPQNGFFQLSGKILFFSKQLLDNKFSESYFPFILVVRRLVFSKMVMVPKTILFQFFFRKYVVLFSKTQPT